MTRRIDHVPLLRISRRRLRSLSASFAAASLLSLSATGSSGQELPWELAFSRLEPAGETGPVVQPSGRAFVLAVQRSADRGTADRAFLDDGTPATAVGSRLRLYLPGDTTGREICPAGDCWRPSWSPDGKLLAFYSAGATGPTVWLTTPDGPARQLTDAPIRSNLYGGDEPRWSPAGTRLYVALRPPAADSLRASASKSVPTDVRVYSTVGRVDAGDDPGAMLDDRLRRQGEIVMAEVDVRTGATRLLETGPEAPRPASLRLSPSGRWISYYSVERSDPSALWGTRHDLSIVPTDGGRARVLASGLATGFETAVDGYRWHPSQDRLYWVADGHLFGLDIGNDPATRPLDLAPGRTVLDRPMAFSRDGSALIVGIEPRVGRHPYDLAPGALLRVPVDGTEPTRIPLDETTWLRALATEDLRRLWQPAPDRALLVSDDRASGESVAMEIDLISGVGHEVGRNRAHVRGFAVSTDGLVGVYEDLTTPADAFTLDAGLRPLQRLSRLEPDLESVAAPRAFRLPVGVTGPKGEEVTVTATMLAPGPPSRHRPTLVMLYPGADLGRHVARYGGGAPITVPTLLFVSRDMQVLLVDLPMPAFGAAIEPADRITAALMPQLDAAIDAGWADPERMSIAGQSYGAYATAAVLTRTERFAAAVAISGVYDLFGSYGRLGEDGTNRWAPWLESGQARLGAHPWEARDRYLRNSPYYLADRIRTPLLLLHGTEEAAFVDAGMLFSALRRLGRAVQLAAYPGEGHVVSEWSRPHAVDAARRMYEFLADAMEREEVH